jgi:hypothetical protein
MRFAGALRAQPGDLADVPDVMAQVFAGEGIQHLRLPMLNGPIEPRDTGFVARVIDDFKAALGVGNPEPASTCSSIRRTRPWPSTFRRWAATSATPSSISRRRSKC